MLKDLMRMYMAYMTFGSTGLMAHLVGPPGSGKSSVVEQLAELLDVELHVINVSRLSPLEVEGVQMPIIHEEEHILRMLPATFWTRLKDGDIVLFDEFLRGFPEVYNGLLDIFTSRRVGAYRLPKVFFVGASNSIAAYDSALEDRLLHMPVADPRKRPAEQKKLTHLIVEELGLHPEMVNSTEMINLLEQEVLPMFDVLDQLVGKKGRKAGAPGRGGRSIRNLIAQVQLRHVVTSSLKDLVEANNLVSMQEGKPQFVILLGKPPAGYVKQARALVGNPKLSPVQEKNLQLNLQMIDLANARIEKEEEA